jgi:N-acetylated-alpha-linked acidic dipeptidase
VVKKKRLKLNFHKNHKRAGLKKSAFFYGQSAEISIFLGKIAFINERPTGLLKPLFESMKKHLLFLCCLAFWQIPSTHAQRLMGFSSAQSEAQLALENVFQTLPTSEAFRQHLENMTAEPHPAGTPANEKVRDYIAEQMRKAGLEVSIHPYDIYMSAEPGQAAVALVEPVRLPLNFEEYILPEDPYSGHPQVTAGWNAYSGSGEVTAEVVYANYGTKEDFEKLAELGISVKGKIVMARYGMNFRGYKAKYAEEAGAAGLIIYTDPADAGYTKGFVFPEGPHPSESTIQRGSLLTLPYSGDPLTPFEPALPRDSKTKVNRLKPEQVALHTIPVMPLPYGSAQEILSRMKGTQAVPSGWQGGLPFTYRLEGGSQLKVYLKVEQKRDFVRVYNVVGTLPGTERPDEWVILGCHYDAWTFGSTDPNSGTAMLLDLATALGKMAANGQRPKRTIKITHWDAEEHGLLGSTEWVEHFRAELSAKTVAYLNADAACSGLNFGAASAPTLKGVLLEAAKAVPYPLDTISVYQHWLGDPAKTEPTIGNLGGGSDHLPFYAHLGIPSLSGGMSGPTLYHSLYDNLTWYKKFGDPTFVSGPTVARVFGIAALRLANAPIIPYDVPRYATDLKKQLTDIEKKAQSIDPAYSAEALLEEVARLQTVASAFENNLKQLLEREQLSASLVKQVNTALLALEKSFIDPKGMEFGAWYQSLYASSDPFSGYASWILPAYQYALAMKAKEQFAQLDQKHLAAFQTLRQRIEALNKLIAQQN